MFIWRSSKSKWPKICVINEAPTSESTIRLLENIFSFQSLSRVLVSNNASIYRSELFKEYCYANSIIPKCISPGHPSTNVLAERREDRPTALKVQDIVYRYRATPLHNNERPSELNLGRNIRTRLDTCLLFRPSSSTHVRKCSVGEHVQPRWYTKNKEVIWKLGIVTAKYSKLYIIKLNYTMNTIFKSK